MNGYYNPLGIGLTPIVAFLDSDDRGNLGIGFNVQFGYAFKRVLSSLVIGSHVGNIGPEGAYLFFNIAYKTF